MSHRMRWARWAFVAAIGVGVVGVAQDVDAAPRRKKAVAVTRQRTTAVPEIPIGGAAAALTLILGGTAVVLDRRRKRQVK